MGQLFDKVATLVVATWLSLGPIVPNANATTFDQTNQPTTFANVPACTANRDMSVASIINGPASPTWGQPVNTTNATGTSHVMIMCNGTATTPTWMVYGGGVGSGTVTPPTANIAAPVVAGHTYTSSMLLTEDTFSSPTIDQTKWYNTMGERGFRWSDNGLLTRPYSGVNCTANTNTSCNNSFSTTYYDPYPYGASYTYNGATTTIGSLTGDRMTGGTAAGLGLSAQSSSSKSNLGYTFTSSAITGCGGAAENGNVCKSMVIPATGGFLQIRAKLADARWGAWPSLWALPVGPGSCPYSGGNSCEMDIQEGGTLGGSCSSAAPDPCANRMLAMHWWGGNGSTIPVVGQQVVDTGVDLSADYHTYGIEYRPGVSWKVYLDGVLKFTWTNGVPTNMAYEVIMDVEVFNNTHTGGPNPPSASWHSYTDAANHPGPFTSFINDVQIYSLAP